MNEKKQMQLKLFLELESHIRNGIPLFLSDVESNPYEIVDAVFLKEDNIYMADYVRDDDGMLLQVRYDRIKAV